MSISVNKILGKLSPTNSIIYTAKEWGKEEHDRYYFHFVSSARMVNHHRGGSRPVSPVSMHRSGFQTDDKFVAYIQLCRKIETILTHIHLAGQFQIKG